MLSAARAAFCRFTASRFTAWRFALGDLPFSDLPLCRLSFRGFPLRGFAFRCFPFRGFAFRRLPLCRFACGGFASRDGFFAFEAFFLFDEINDFAFCGSPDELDDVEAIGAFAIALPLGDNFVVSSAESPAPFAGVIFVDFEFHDCRPPPTVRVIVRRTTRFDDSPR